MSDTLIKVENLHKKFCQSLKRSMFYGTIDATQSIFGLPIENVGLRKKEFWALQDINFELKQGETLGLIGQNGCGKTTLLRLLNGIFPPDKGLISIKGRIGALIAIGAGFHPHMTGRENIFLNGTILGMTKAELKRKFDTIVDFASIGDFIDSPVATYSSGMTVRLGFAIAIHCEPDILLIDEILAVGDAGFQLKCFNKLGELRNNGVGTILVTHDMHNISTYSNRLFLLHQGKPLYFGAVSEGLSIYKKTFSSLNSLGEIEKPINGTNEFKVFNVTFTPNLINNNITLRTFEDITYCIEYEATRDFENLEIDNTIELPIPGAHYFQANNFTYNKTINVKKGKGKIYVTIEKVTINNFTILLSFALWENNKKNILIWWNKIPIYVEGVFKSTGWGHLNIDYKVDQ